jgi:hypothetical protein
MEKKIMSKYIEGKPTKDGFYWVRFRQKVVVYKNDFYSTNSHLKEKEIESESFLEGEDLVYILFSKYYTAIDSIGTECSHIELDEITHYSPIKKPK